MVIRRFLNPYRLAWATNSPRVGIWGELRTHLRGEGGDSNFGRRDLHAALLEVETKALPRERDLRPAEQCPELLRGTPGIRERLQTVFQADGDVPDDHALEVVAEIIQRLRLCREIVIEAVGTEPFAFLETTIRSFVLAIGVKRITPARRCGSEQKPKHRSRRNAFRYLRCWPKNATTSRMASAHAAGSPPVVAPRPPGALPLMRVGT